MHGVDVTREEVQKIVDAADKDGTGLLTEKEFVYSQAVGDVSEFLSATSLKYSLWCRESTRNPTIYNMIRWFACSLGQITGYLISKLTF